MWQTEKKVTVGGGELAEEIVAMAGVGVVVVASSQALWTWVRNVDFI